MKVSVVTPTADRPVAFRLAEQWMARQTRQPDEWIVADGGQTPVACTMGQTHAWVAAPAGPSNFLANVTRGLSLATGDVIVFWEDDDWYAPTHLAVLTRQLAEASVAGDDEQRYYNLGHRCWRTFENTGASLCQTGLRRSLLATLLRAIETCACRSSYGVDTTFWRSVPRTDWALARTRTVVGLKGLPGNPGLGIGHRPTGHWTGDRRYRTLRAWLGADAAVYEALIAAPMAASTGTSQPRANPPIA